MNNTNIEIKTAPDIASLLAKRGYSNRAIREIWKWYDHSEKKGVVSY